MKQNIWFTPKEGENIIRILPPMDYKFGGKDEMKNKEARFGEQSKADVISAWGFSSSSGTTVYETQLHADGILTCNCPGWVNYPKRECKHVRSRVEQATAILSGFQPPVFERCEIDQVLVRKNHTKEVVRSGRFIEVEEG